VAIKPRCVPNDMRRTARMHGAHCHGGSVRAPRLCCDSA
jgi:hypothetical protein